MTAASIATVVFELVDRCNLDQLMIYFGGHGIVRHYSEYWLLSGAPKNGNEAVNVTAAEALARRCGIPHVIFVSDTCRTAADSIQAQGVDGSAIFPNIEPFGPENAVDIFFATLLGSASLEIRDVRASAEAYRAIYTDEFRAALDGAYPSYLDYEYNRECRVLRPRSLKKLLYVSVPERLKGLLDGHRMIAQTPDARITSDESAWLAEFTVSDESEDLPFVVDATGSPIQDSNDVRDDVAEQSANFEPFERIVALGVIGPQSELMDRRGPLLTAGAVTLDTSPSNSELFQQEIAYDLSRARFTTELPPLGMTGFRLIGASLRGAYTRNAQLDHATDHTLLVATAGMRSGDVLLEVGEAHVVLLPFIVGYTATLYFDSGELLDVTYQPVERCAAHDAEANTSWLRSLLATSVRRGGIRIIAHDHTNLYRLLRDGVITDPSIGVYAAHYFHNVARLDLVGELWYWLRNELGFVFGDLTVLTRGALAPVGAIAGAIPLLSPGWPLTSHASTADPDITGNDILRSFVVESLWTVFEGAALPVLRSMLERQ